jgi:hypothetical protein
MEKRKKLIISITGLHNKPQGCGASVASAAGPFTTKKLRLDAVCSLSNLHNSLFINIPFNAILSQLLKASLNKQQDYDNFTPSVGSGLVTPEYIDNTARLQ